MVRNVILMGRGIEGCGVTKSVIEFAKTQPCEIFATKDKIWGRRTAHGDFGAQEFTAANWDECQRVLDQVEGADRVIVYSIPPLDFPQAAQDNFLEMIRRIKAKKAMVHLDHSVKALYNNSNLLEILGEMDVVMTHSVTGALGKYMAKSNVLTPIRSVGLGFDFDEHRRRYWRPIDEQDDWMVRWIGRTARWKGPQAILDLHETHLRGLGYKTGLEGLEASINWVITVYHDEHEKQQPRDVILKFRAWPGKPIDKVFTYDEIKRGDPAWLYPPYKNDECMGRLALSAFGSDLYNLHPSQYGSSIENCHGEIVASGAVPIFHKHFGDHVIHRRTGDPCTASDRSGTVWLGPDGRDQVADTMLRLSEDRVMRDEWREMAFEFWREHADAQVVSQDIVNVVDGIEPPVSIEDFFG